MVDGVVVVLVVVVPVVVVPVTEVVNPVEVLDWLVVDIDVVSESVKIHNYALGFFQLIKNYNHDHLQSN